MTRSPPTATLFPYTTLFRSLTDQGTFLGNNSQPLEAQQWTTANESNALFDGYVCRRRTPVPTLLKKSLDDATLRSEEHTSELQSHSDLVCRLLLEKKKQNVH